jgi:hypothetical protein
MPRAKEEGDSENENSDSDDNRAKPQIKMFGKNKNETTRNIFKQRKKYHSAHGQKKSKSWILGKKERARKQGKDVKTDSKFSGRRRNNGGF